MKSPLKIVMISSEVAPFAKTGGLADVVGALPQVLRGMGHEVIVVMPRYGSIDGRRFGLRRHWDSMGVWMGNTQEWCAVDIAYNDGTPVYFIESNKFFERPGLYHDDDFNDYQRQPAALCVPDAGRAPVVPGPRLCAGYRARARLADRAGSRLSEDLALERPAAWGRRQAC